MHRLSSSRSLGVALLLSLVACSVESPEYPSWDPVTAKSAMALPALSAGTLFNLFGVDLTTATTSIESNGSTTYEAESWTANHNPKKNKLWIVFHIPQSSFPNICTPTCTQKHLEESVIATQELLKRTDNKNNLDYEINSAFVTIGAGTTYSNESDANNTAILANANIKLEGIPISGARVIAMYTEGFGLKHYKIDLSANPSHQTIVVNDQESITHKIEEAKLQLLHNTPIIVQAWVPTLGEDGTWSIAPGYEVQGQRIHIAVTATQTQKREQ